ncbi:MAG TPA: hypothetical protein VKG63_15625 [Steroidobacteraceae bacterium]|nr:hypothetical protein [Steroidobacteraceae bacterium]
MLKASVSCAALLERLPPVWRLDRAESTRRNLKYRRGEGEIVIVNHEGRGWWDPLSDHKGDVFTLVQHLDPGLNFGDARRVLSGFAGIAPTFPEALRTQRARASHIPVAQRWDWRPRLSCGSPAWRYLTERRKLALLANFGPVVLTDFGPSPVPQPTVARLDRGTWRGLESQSGFV